VATTPVWVEMTGVYYSRVVSNLCRKLESDQCRQVLPITVGIGSGFSGRVRVGFGLTISVYSGLSSGSFFVHHEMFYESVWKK